MTRKENDAVLADVYKRAGLPRFADAFKVPELPKCPKCGAEDSMERCKTLFPDAPVDTYWSECVVCGHRTDPE